MRTTAAVWHELRYTVALTRISSIAFYSETCFHIRRLFPKGGHQHWFFGHDADFVVVTYEFLGFGIIVPCRCPDRVSAQLPQYPLAARLP